MIFDKIENLDLYNIPKDAVDFIKNLKPDFPLGRYFISEKIYANVEEYSTKSHVECFFEAHKNYIDIQLLLKGAERIDTVFSEGLRVKEEYNPQRDIEFFFDDKRDVQSIKLEPGVFTVLYPHEAHKPQMNFRGCENVKKVVDILLDI